MELNVLFKGIAKHPTPIQTEPRHYDVAVICILWSVKFWRFLKKEYERYNMLFNLSNQYHLSFNSSKDMVLAELQGS